MKKFCLLMCICFSLFILVSASIWEGAAEVAGPGLLPETGRYIATNSFPGNTVVDIINLENGRQSRVIVSSGLETSGLLAVLSRDAANAIGMEGRSVGRIRMSESSEQMAAAHRREVRGTLPESDEIELGNNETEAAGTVIAEAAPIETAAAGTEPIETTPVVAAAIETAAPVVTAPAKEEVKAPHFELTMIPSEHRPPANGPQPDPAFVIPGITQVLDNDKTNNIRPCMDGPAAVMLPEIVPEILPEILPAWIAEPVQPFSRPLITTLETGMYYVQVAAFSNAESVQAEIYRIGSSYPVKIMNAGTSEFPVFRILIGPLTLGESGALLHRFRMIYSDAFIRAGS